MELRAIHKRVDQVSTVPASFNTCPFPLLVIGKDSSMILSCSNSLMRYTTKSERIQPDSAAQNSSVLSALIAAFHLTEPPRRKKKKNLRST